MSSNGGAEDDTSTGREPSDGGTPTQETGVRGVAPMNRRSWLKYTAAAVGASAIGGGATSDPATASHVTDLEPPATESDVPGDEPVDRSAMTENRLDISDGEDLSTYVANNSGSGQLLVVPGGTYEWNNVVTIGPSNWGIRGEWGSQVTIQVPDGWGINDGDAEQRMLDLWNGGDNIVIENLYIDTQSHDARAASEIRVRVDERGLYHHIIWMHGGTTSCDDTGRNRVTPVVRNTTGRILLDGLVVNNRGTIEYQNNGDRLAYAGRSNDGHLEFRNCKASGFADNVIYTRSSGDLTVENCVFANTTPAMVRVGGHDEVVRNCTFWLDTDRAELYDEGGGCGWGNVSTNPIFADNNGEASDGGSVENCSFVVESTPSAIGAIRKADNLEFEVYDSQFMLNQGDVPGIGVQNSDMNYFTVERTEFHTGNGSGATAAQDHNGEWRTSDVCIDDGLSDGALTPDTRDCSFDWSQVHSFPEDGDLTIPGEPGGGDTSGDVAYGDDATAVHADHYDTSDRAGVEFTVTNQASQQLTVTHASISPHDSSINELHDESDSIGRWVSEIHVDADVQNGVCDPGASASLPNTFDMANDGWSDDADQVAVMSAGSTASVAFSRFEADGTPIDMVGEQVDVDLDYELDDGSTGTASFTLYVDGLDYQSDATAVHADHYDTSDRAGVEFSVVNSADQAATLTHVTITPHDTSINELHDESDSIGRWVSEIHVDADVQNGVCDPGASASLPNTFDMANDGWSDDADQVAILSSGAVGSVAFSRFEADGTPIDMVGEQVDVEFDYELDDGTTASSAFTLDVE